MGNNIQQKHNGKMTYGETHAQLKYVASCVQGWRQYMEDAHLAIYPFAGNQQMGLFAVFDGHGGPQVAQYAQKHFPDCLSNNPHFINKCFQKALKQTFLQIDKLMKSQQGQKEMQKIREQDSKKDNAVFYKGQTFSGCTANVVLLTKDYIYCANAGDSRAIASLKKKINNIDFQQLSFDHKPTLYREEQRIVRAGGFVSSSGRVNQNLNVSRGFGDFQLKKNDKLSQNQQMITAVPDITKIQTRSVSFIIMGCDGIWERKSNAQMVKYIINKRQKHRGCINNVVEDLLDDEIGKDAVDKHGMDNMTAILIQFNN